MNQFIDHNLAMDTVFKPDTSAEELEAIAQAQPSLRHLVAGHANVSPLTITWLAAENDPNVMQVIDSRGIKVQQPPAPQALPNPTPPKQHQWAIWVAALAVVLAVTLIVTLLPRSPQPGPATPDSSSPSETKDKKAEPWSPAVIDIWRRPYGGSGHDIFKAVAITPSVDFIVVGSTDSPDGDFPVVYSGRDAVVARLTNEGDLLWTHVFGGNGDDEFTSVTLDGDGNIYAAGNTTSTSGDFVSQGGTDAIAVKLNSYGDLIWARRYGGAADDSFTSVVAYRDGVVVAGFTDSTDGDFPARHGKRDALLATIDADGNLIWARTYGGAGVDEFASVIQGADDGFVAVGKTNSRDGDFASSMEGWNAVIAGFKPDGELAWAATHGGNDDDEFNAVAHSADGVYYIAGATNSIDNTLNVDPDSIHADTSGVFGEITSTGDNTVQTTESWGNVIMTAAANVEEHVNVAVGLVPEEPMCFLDLSYYNAGEYWSNEWRPEACGFHGVAVQNRLVVAVGISWPYDDNYMPAVYGGPDALVAVYTIEEE